MTRLEKSWDNLFGALRRIGERGSKNPRHPSGEDPDLVTAMSELVLYDDPLDQKSSLVHYTSWKSALSMFGQAHRNPILRMYNYEHCNDPEEGRIKPPDWKDVEEEMENWVKAILKTESDRRWIDNVKFGSTYGCSFSSGTAGEIEDNLTYWRFYGNNGQGCSLKISRFNQENKEIVDAYNVHKVRYRSKDFEGAYPEKEEDEKVAERLRELLDVSREIVDKTSEDYRHEICKAITEKLYRVIYGYYHLIKDIAYRSECEWRMIKVRPEWNDIRYDTTSENLVRRYVDGPVIGELLRSGSVITVGPTLVNPDIARDCLLHLIEKAPGIDYVPVKTSTRKYRQTPSR